MNINNFTIKAQEAVAAAQQLAFNAQNQQIDVAHLLKAMLDNDDNSIEYLLKKNDVNVNYVDQKLNEILQRIPKINSGFAEVISKELNQVVLKAGSYLKDFGDEFVSLDHLLLAMVSGNDAVANILKDAGLSEKNLKKSILESRKGSTVNSAREG